MTAAQILIAMVKLSTGGSRKSYTFIKSRHIIIYTDF